MERKIMAFFFCFLFIYGQPPKCVTGTAGSTEQSAQSVYLLSQVDRKTTKRWKSGQLSHNRQPESSRQEAKLPPDGRHSVWPQIRSNFWSNDEWMEIDGWNRFYLSPLRPIYTNCCCCCAANRNGDDRIGRPMAFRMRLQCNTCVRR